MGNINENFVFRELVSKFKEIVMNDNTVSVSIECSGLCVTGICDISDVQLEEEKLCIVTNDFEFVIDNKAFWKYEREDDVYRAQNDSVIIEFVF